MSLSGKKISECKNRATEKGISLVQTKASLKTRENLDQIFQTPALLFTQGMYVNCKLYASYGHVGSVSTLVEGKGQRNGTHQSVSLGTEYSACAGYSARLGRKVTGCSVRFSRVGDKEEHTLILTVSDISLCIRHSMSVPFPYVDTQGVTYG